MGAYSLDRSSPKKGMPRSGFLEVKRRLSSRRYICLWVFLALVPCYMLRQMFSYQAPSRSAYIRDAAEERLPTTATENAVQYEKPSEPETKKESVLDFIFKHNTIKPAQYGTVVNPSTNKVENVTRNSLKLKLKENFVDDEDFGSAEDNDKAEEQMWTAPPALALPKK